MTKAIQKIDPVTGQDISASGFVGEAKPTKPERRNPFTYDTSIPIDRDLGEYQPSEYLGDLSQTMMDWYGERMDPGFSIVTPEQESAMNRQIASNMAITTRDIEDSMRARGLFGSGVSGALTQDAAFAAARARADMEAKIAMENEAARERAAHGMEGYRRWQAEDEWRRAKQLMDLPGEFVSATGDVVRGGPDMIFENVTDWIATDQGLKFLEDERERARQAEQWDAYDIIGLLIEAVTTGFLGG